MSSILHWALVAIVCLAPLPLASNRPLPWSVLSLSVGILLLIWGADRLRAAFVPAPAARSGGASRGGPARESPGHIIDQHAAVLAAGFAVLLLWYWVQGSSVLADALDHPAWAEASVALGENLAGSPSLGPAAGTTLAMKILAYAGVFLLAFQLGGDRARTTFWALCLAGLCYAIYGLFMRFSHAGTVLWFVNDAYRDSVTSTFINRNSYATYAGMGVIVALTVLLSELRRLKPDGMTATRFLVQLSDRGSGTLYLAVVLTGSRAGNACLVLALAVFAFGMLKARDIRLRTFIVSLALGGIVLVWVLWLSGGLLARRLASEGEPEARIAVFEVARSAAAAHPWIGQGLGNFEAAFNRANDGRAIFDTYVDLAHNAYLELAVEAGIPAMLLSLALVGGCIGICFTGLLARGTSAAIGAIAIGALVGTHSLVDFSFQMPAVAATFMLIVGVAAAQALALDQAGQVDMPEFATRGAGQRRTQHRRRFGHDRPLSADEPVTPPAEPDMPWPVRSRTIDRATLARISAAPVVDADAPAPETQPPAQGSDRMPQGASDSAGTDYEAALARWRNLREANAPDPEPDAAAGRLITTRHPTPNLAETPAPNEPEPTAAAPARDRAAAGSATAPDAASTATPHDPSSPTIVPFTPRGPASGQTPPRQRQPGERGDAAYGAQPPTPQAWPVADRRAAPALPDEDARPQDADRRSATVIDLPSSPKS
jgi:O-antigen ligase